MSQCLLPATLQCARLSLPFPFWMPLKRPQAIPPLLSYTLGAAMCQVQAAMLVPHLLPHNHGAAMCQVPRSAAMLTEAHIPAAAKLLHFTFLQHHVTAAMQLQRPGAMQAQAMAVPGMPAMLDFSPGMFPIPTAPPLFPFPGTMMWHAAGDAMARLRQSGVYAPPERPFAPIFPFLTQGK